MQNLILTASATFRLDLYVAAYSMTWLRLCALLWLGLTAAVLGLFLLRLRLGRSNGWLLKACMATAAGLLYLCCFVNFPQLIGAYNVAHCKEAAGTGPVLDLT